VNAVPPRYVLSVTVRTALTVGSGSDHPGVVRRIARDADGIPCIPASALRGALRINLERTLRGATQGPAVCAGGDPAGSGDCGARPCPVCVLFGRPGLAGVLRFQDARLPAGEIRTLLSRLRHAPVATRPRARSPVDRASRVAAGVAAGGEGAIRVTPACRESSSPFMTGLSFEATVRSTRRLTEGEEQLLEAAARSVVTIGGWRSGGSGHVAVTLGRRDADPDPAAAPAAAATEAPAATEVPAATVSPADVRAVLTARSAFRAGRAGGGPAGSIGPSIDHVPGPSLRGALAAALAGRLERGTDDPVFRRAFGNPGVRVTNAHPAARRVAPATLVTCDALPGFHLRSGAQTPRSLWSHGAWDTLLVRFFADRLRGRRPWSWSGRCPLELAPGSGPCPGVLVPLAASYVPVRPGDEQTAAFCAVETRRGVGRGSDRSPSRALRSEMVVLPGRHVQRYEATLHGLDPEALAQLRAAGELSIGGSLATGRGVFSLRLEAARRPDVRAALEAAEEAVARLLSAWPGGSIARSDVGLDRMRLAIIDLWSDWIPRRWHATLSDTAAADIPRAGDVEVLTAWLTTGSTGGWNGPAGLPRPLRRSLRRGGVVLLGYSVLHETALVSMLERLLDEGVGMLTRDGYGQVLVSDPSHWERVPPLPEGR
jgi:hypothetical protein